MPMQRTRRFPFRPAALIALACLACLPGFVPEALAQAWKNTNLPGGAGVMAIWNVPAPAGGKPALLAGTWKGRIFRSEDQGKTWNLVLSGAGSSVGVFREFGGSLFAGAGSNIDLGLWDCWTIIGGCGDPSKPGGVFRSRDGGKTWTRGPGDFGAVAFTSRHDSLFAASANALMVSPDTGRTWTRVVFQGTDKPTGRSVRGIETLSNAFYFLSNGGLWVARANEGWTWRMADRGARALARTVRGSLLVSSAGRNEPGFPAGYGAGIREIPALGNEIPLSTKQFNALTIRGDTVYGSSDSVAWLSSDGGKNWKAWSAPLAALRDARASRIVDGALMVGGYDWQGLHVLAANGKSWTTLSTGMYDTAVTDLMVRSGSIFAADGPVGLLVRGAGPAAAWAQGTAGPDAVEARAFGILGGPGAGGFPAAAGAGVFLASQEEGKAGTWRPLQLDAEPADRIPLAFAAGTGWSGYFQVYGHTLMVCPDAVPFACRPAAMLGFPERRVDLITYYEYNGFRAMAASGNTVVAALADSVFRSLDRGEHWSPLGPVPGPVIFAAFRNGALLLGTASSPAPGSKGALLTWDEAAHAWKADEDGNLKGTPGDLALRPDGEAFLATDDGLYRKGLWDAHWREVGGLPLRDVRAVAVDGNLLAAALGNGEVWALDLDPPSALGPAAAFRQRPPGALHPYAIPDGKGGFLRADGKTLPRLP
jgi:hypothetical protein